MKLQAKLSGLSQSWHCLSHASCTGELMMPFQYTNETPAFWWCQSKQTNNSPEMRLEGGEKGKPLECCRLAMMTSYEFSVIVTESQPVWGKASCMPWPQIPIAFINYCYSLTPAGSQEVVWSPGGLCFTFTRAAAVKMNLALKQVTTFTPYIIKKVIIKRDSTLIVVLHEISICCLTENKQALYSSTPVEVVQE